MKILVVTKLARSGSEANRLIKQGAIHVGGCKPDCTFFTTGKCTCGGWEKINNPAADIQSGLCVKVGNGLYRSVKRIDGRDGVDQLKGVAHVPPDATPMAEESGEQT